MSSLAPSRNSLPPSSCMLRTCEMNPTPPGEWDILGYIGTPGQCEHISLESQTDVFSIFQRPCDCPEIKRNRPRSKLDTLPL